MKLERKVQHDDSRLFSKLLDILYPPRCPFCGKLLRYYEKNICRLCSAGISRISHENQRTDLKNIDLCVSLYRYEGSVRESLHRYKFSGCASYGRSYAALLAEILPDYDIDCDVITWVPISSRRLRGRGYDQSELIARELGRLFGLPCEKLLRKTIHNRAQSSTASAEERKRNAAGVYKTSRNAELSGKKVLIVDDIVTTGATLCECAEVLKAAGCGTVLAVTVAASVKK